MESHKTFASEQLLSLSKVVIKEMTGVRRTKVDDDLDAEYKRGAKDAFARVTDLIYEQIDSLIGEIEPKK